MKKEANEGVQNVKEALKRTAEATCVSDDIVRTVVEKCRKEELLPVFEPPGKKVKKSQQFMNLNEIDQSLIKTGIHNFHLTNKKFPTVKKLLIKFREDINFQGNGENLRTIAKNLGFRCKKTEANGKVLIEKTNMRLKRIEYLQAIRKYRQEGRPIVYTYMSHVYSTPTLKYDKTLSVLKQSKSKYQRVVILHAGSETVFVPNGFGAYHGEIYIDDYEQWLNTKLIPNIPPNAVVVIEYASYNNKQYEVAPTLSSKKCDMESWLTEKGIHFDSEMLKPQLYNLVKINRDRFETFCVSTILTQHKHIVLCLPPYDPGLNPLEIVWADIKDFDSGKQFEFNRILELIKEKLDAISSDQWQKLHDKVKKVEEEYLMSDQIVDDLTDQLRISFDISSDSGSELDTDSDESTSSSVGDGNDYMDPLRSISLLPSISTL